MANGGVDPSRKGGQVAAEGAGAETKTRPPATGGFGARTLAWAGRIVGGLLSAAIMAALLIAGGVYLRLQAGPIDLDGYLPAIQSAASKRLPDAAISMDGARIAVSETGGARLEVSGIDFADDSGEVFATIPQASAAFRVWDLARGVIDPDDVALSGISGRLVKNAKGEFRFGFGGLAETEAEAGFEAFRSLLAAATEGDDADAAEEPAARGQVFRIEDASVVYVDEQAGRAYRARDAVMRFWRIEGGIVARADAVLDGGRHGAARFSLSGQRTNEGALTLEATFENTAPVDIAGQINALDWMAAFDAPVSGSLKLSMDGPGALTALSGAFEIGAGDLRLADDAIEPLDGGRLIYTFEPEAERFVIDEMRIDADRVRLTGAGFVQVGRDDAGAPQDVVAQLDFSDIRVAAPELLDAPLDYRGGRVTGRLTLEPLLIELGEVRLERERMQLGASGRIWRGEESWQADVSLEASDFSLAEMLAHWPRDAAPGALLWMRENMETAHIIDTDGVVRLGGDAEEVKIDFTFDNAKGHYLRPMPPIRNGVGSGQVDLERFSLILDSGVVTMEGGEDILLDGSTFVIADLNHPDTPGTARIVAQGRTKDALALIDTEPLRLTSALDVPLGDVGGAVVVKAVSEFPLLKDLLLEDVTADAEAAFTDLVIAAPGLDRPVRAATLNMKANTSAFEISGDVNVSGLPASVVWNERFSPAERTIRGRARLTPERLKAFGIEQAWFTGGAIPVTATLAPGAEGARFDVKATLDDAALAVAEIDWRKAAGRKASLSARGEMTGAGLVLDAFDFDAPGLAADGSVRMTASGAPLGAKINRLRFRDAVDIGVAARRGETGWAIEADGRLIDFSKLDDLIEKALEDDGGGAADAAPLSLSVKVGEVRLTDDVVFTNLSGDLARNAAVGVEGALSGALMGGAVIDAAFARKDDGGAITLTTSDAGRFMRDAGVFDDGSGGAVTIEAEIGAGGDLSLTGTARVRDLVIHEDAKLEGMLAGGDLDELRAEMREDGIVFRKIKAPFRYEDGVLRLKDASAKGPQIGVNLSGRYTFASEALDFKGVFTPLYALNSALGKIPLLGGILTGGDGQGVFAFNFKVSGPASDPNVSVNPLSVLTPGILRNLLPAGDASQTLDVTGRQAEDGDR